MSNTPERLIEALGLTDDAIIDPKGDFRRAAACRVVTDTRSLAPGDVFLALRGERFDGHDFLETARDRGAVAAIVEAPVEAPVEAGIAQLIVADTRLALGLLARYHRLHWQGRLAAITGNSGKTTVRALCEAILSRSGPTHATRGNLNNDIGVPLTLLQLDDSCAQAVIEAGANHTGEIAWTTSLARPDVVLINNVTDAHIGEFGSAGHIAQAKAEILSGLSPDGVAILNRNDRFYPVWAALASGHEVLDFGIDVPARVQAVDMVSDEGFYRFTLAIDGEEIGRVALPLMGRHNVMNALGAAAAAHAMGCAPVHVLAGLNEAEGVARRMIMIEGIRGTTLIDDSYNANPGAMRASLDTLVQRPGPRWCFLGAMGELGHYSVQAHEALGHYARDLDIDQVVTIGEPARAISTAAGARGRHFDDWAAMIDFARHSLPSQASVLIKGSLDAGMDRLVNALRSESSGDDS
ncbi:UDP-N-acetylmuramoyl-tripeptide--D-alanyl-D-alanine ligase [Kushneria indalinina]|uniref:UDP-N-acetylmuramoyl-tripeptide--D-alanyl-D-alanine ligase n=1 Tax=Kushneria indalinina DSM 14324 TaxID=1122140 RepID=A0A3D9E0G2_9GAMM|nr:UDP-N-acetylmuramoyl-tripeptide--D-alanyl-D-alanine ligase [Kushneria indalinina]REC96518.1 UDP-N-acetylmuramoyl-tripeptide--D-alanyl-D-alanine ligase [Kushneria indalinina DSM 14324]